MLLVCIGLIMVIDVLVMKVGHYKPGMRNFYNAVNWMELFI
ncbi:hypothetical protein [Ehrlichia japonica]|uniref:Uncharacterized protein n=1 Tax=Ehrlichia japonica TaxID=391036 RepID=X5GJA4_9RICK|nr:hypothetical protein [Ehrlichia japonica]AHX04246.1 hypothetical protein EHF_0569 [Ehrlichia japonica]